MAYKIDTTDDDIQEQFFELYDRKMKFILRYNEVGKYFTFDLFDTKTSEVLALNQGLAVNAPSLLSSNLGFVVVLFDRKEGGVNALYKEDIKQRLEIYFMTVEEWKELIRWFGKELIS